LLLKTAEAPAAAAAAAAATAAVLTADSNSGSSNGSNAHYSKQDRQVGNVTLLLFYQYVEPPWTAAEHDAALKFTAEAANRLVTDMCIQYVYILYSTYTLHI
jgi:ABC-type sugar transport system substrate-binding protein